MPTSSGGTYPGLHPSQRPEISALDRLTSGESGRQYWLVGGKIRGLARQVITGRQFAEISRRAGRNMATSQETPEIENVAAGRATSTSRHRREGAEDRSR